MGEPANATIELHAPPVPRHVVMGHDDPEVRAAVTAQVAALFDDPPALVLTGSCSAALEAAAALVDLAPGDEVVVPAFTFPTSIIPFVARGATVRFADVVGTTGNVDVASVAAKVNDRTRAVVVMHYGGVAVDLAAVDHAIAGRAIDVIEDAAHGVFARVDGRPLGRSGRFGCVSFHRTKNLSSIEGGALIVNRDEDIEAALVAVDKGTNRAAFESGRTTSYEWCGLGGSWRMPDAAVQYLAEELARAEVMQATRQVAWRRYQTDLADWAGSVGVALPAEPERCSLPAHLYPLVLPTAADRPAFVAHLSTLGVQAARHYGAMPDTPFGRTIVRADDACPVAVDLAGRLVRIPLHHGLTATDIDQVIEAVRSWPGGVVAASG